MQPLYVKEFGAGPCRFSRHPTLSLDLPRSFVRKGGKHGESGWLAGGHRPVLLRRDTSLEVLFLVVVATGVWLNS